MDFIIYMRILSSLYGIHFQQDGKTALHIACEKDNYDVIQELLEKFGADVNCQDKVMYIACPASTIVQKDIE